MTSEIEENEVRVTKEMIDPSLRRPGAVMTRLMGTARTEEQLRLPDPPAMRVFAKIPLRGVRRSSAHVRRADGSQLRLLVLTPKKGRPTGPSVLWIHGGGYRGGSPDVEASFMARVVRAHGGVVVSPDYRLSPEAPYPAALDDCYLALTWLSANAARLGGRRDQVVVAGASAGGGLTAATTLLARDRGEVKIAFQAPIYPMIDDRDTASSTGNDAPVWDSTTNRNAWKLYLGELYGKDVPEYAAPARATDLTGLPPTITYVGDIEPFYDETLAYVRRLQTAEVPAELLVVPGAWHGLDGLAPWSPPAKRARRWFENRFAEAVRTHTAPQPDLDA